MNIETKEFGNIQEHQIDQYVLTNDNGMTVKISTYGATITSIAVPDMNGNLIELACGFDTLEGYFSEEYRNNAPYFGCTVGRYSSRIKDGKFVIDDKAYQLATNDGPNHLHGGLKGFDKKIWKATTIEDQHTVGVIMKLESLHMEEGYPGNVVVSVTFKLSANNELMISYDAETDQITPLSLTNHTYFNLSGFQETIENHTALIAAKTHLKPDATNVPVGEIEDLTNQPSDLSRMKPLSEAFEGLSTGFEHYFVFDKALWEMEKVAEFTDSKSNRKLEVFTTEPGMLFYTGYFTSDDLKRENGDKYGRFRGFCCETHRYPNGPNIKGSPGSFITPLTPFKSQTTYKITW